VFGRHWNAGQVCVSSKRMIVVDAVYDDFLALYRKGVAELVAGDPFDAKTTLAPLSSQSAANEVKQKILEAVKLGAKAEEVGPPVPVDGAFVQPTILTDVAEDNPARYWEFFGPVSMLFRAKDEDDAVRIANDSPFGLGGSVFTSDTAHGAEVAKKNLHRHGVRQPSDQGRSRPAFRWRAPLGVWPRADRSRAQGVRQPQAHCRGRYRRPVLSSTALFVPRNRNRGDLTG
jgi:hypothetical protein